MLEAKDKRLLFFVILAAFMYAWVLTKEPAEIYGGYLIIIPLLLVYIVRYGIPTQFWLFAGFFVFTGLVNIAANNNEADQFLKIFLGVMMSYLFFYYVLKRFDFDVQVIFRAYLIGALIVSIIGLIQFSSYLVGFRPGYDFTWLGIFNKWGVVTGGNLGIRVNSIFGEPSTYAAVMAPAMFVSLNNLITRAAFVYKRWQSILVLAVYLLTFSSLGYLGIFVALLLLMINYGFARLIFLFVPLFAVAFVVLYNYVPDFQYRWDSTITLFQTGQVDIKTEHGSAIVFYNNYVVATENLGNNFLFGSGLGSHPVAFEKYSITKDIQTFGFANNSSDANSMLLRIISEIGLIGVVFAFVFIRRGLVRRDPYDAENKYWIISAATLCILILYLLRQGHYFLNGFPLFVWIYYYTRKNADAYQIAKEEQAQEENEESVSDEMEEDGDE